MWKPGQLVTVEGKVYRICHNTQRGFAICRECALKSRKDCTLAKSPCDKIDKKYIVRSYFKQVYPKTQKGKVLGVY